MFYKDDSDDYVFNAENMKKIVESKNDVQGKIDREKEALMETIKKAANDGRNGVTVDSIQKENYDYLISIGFSITQNHRRAPYQIWWR